MGQDRAQKRSSIYCPRCGQQAGCLLFGDAEFICKRCGFDFLVYIAPKDGMIKNEIKNSLNEKQPEEYGNKNTNLKPTQ